MKSYHCAEFLRKSVLAVALLVCGTAGVSWGQATDGGSGGGSTVRAADARGDDDGDGMDWGWLGLLGLLGLAGLRPRRDHVVHDRTNVARP